MYGNDEPRKALATEIFTLREDRELGGLGWFPRWAPETFYGNLEGRMFAHDMLEHKPNDSGSVADECRALGAVLRVRGDWLSNPYNGGTSYHEAIQSDLISMLRDTDVFSNYELSFKAKRLPRGLSFDLVHDREWINELVTMLQREYNNDDNPPSAREYRQLVRCALQYMKQGYIEACKRYPKHLDMRHVFMQTAEAVDKHLKYEEYSEGEQLTVIVYDDATCTIEDNRDDYNDESDESEEG